MFLIKYNVFECSVVLNWLIFYSDKQFDSNFLWTVKNSERETPRLSVFMSTSTSPARAKKTENLVKNNKVWILAVFHWARSFSFRNFRSSRKHEPQSTNSIYSNKQQCSNLAHSNLVFSLRISRKLISNWIHTQEIHLYFSWIPRISENLLIFTSLRNY